MCALKCECLVCVLFVSLCILLTSITFSNRTYDKKRLYFSNASSSGHVNSSQKATAEELLNNAARVREIHSEVAYEISLGRKSRGEIASSVPEDLLMKAVSSEGYLAQANHLVSTGVNADQLMEFESAIRAVDHKNGATWTELHGDLRVNNDGISRAAAQRARNTGISAEAIQDLTKDDEDVSSGDGLVGQARPRKKYRQGGDGVEVIAMPERWPFVSQAIGNKSTDRNAADDDELENMKRRVRTNLMKLTTNEELTASAKKKAGRARTGLATGDKKYVSIVEDCVAMPEKPGSQEVTKYCMTQASLDGK